MTIYGLDAVFPDLPADGDYWVAPNAVVVGRVKLGARASVWFGTVLRGDLEAIDIGADTNIQDLSVGHADPGFPLIVGEGCTIGHRTMLHGCRIGDNCLIGMGTTILNGAVIGDNCLIGANTLILEGREIPARSLVIGSPGKVVRPLDQPAIEQLRESARRYRDNARRYAAGLSVSPSR
jgi:carbonic anhydrase/acetyltransferase-like protein (isoleucine patch superfamily)